MIKEKKRGLLIVVSGPSGAGKDTVCNRLVDEQRNIWISVSMTSREPRKNEVNGKDYYFITKEEFEEKINSDEFLEYAVVHSGQYYGTPKSKIEEKLNKGIDVILVIDIQGALKIKEQIEEALFIFILPPSMEELKKRLLERNTESKSKILERFKTAYNEINEIKKYNYVVVNDRVDYAVDKVKSIIKAEKCRVDRIEDIYLNTKEELDTFITNPKNKIIELYKLEYIKNFALKQDVIKKTNFDGKEKYLTAIDRYGYAIYNPERSKKSNKFIWEYQYGSLKDIYEEFRNRGITFENNVYLKLEEDKELDILIKKRINSKLKQKNK